ncbi:MAG: DUF1801 domain-containing protein [Pseudomonadota bacterium]
MANRDNKTRQTDISPAEFLETVEPLQRREDGKRLLPWFAGITGLAPRMWGDSMIGYGRYAYTYASGHSGEMFLTGFSPRKSALSLYVLPGYEDLGAQLRRLGKHKLGKSCLYIKRLDDVDIDVLEEIVRQGLDEMRLKYETWDE